VRPEAQPPQPRQLDGLGPDHDGPRQPEAAQPLLPGLGLRVAHRALQFACFLEVTAAEAVGEGGIEVAQGFLGRARGHRIQAGQLARLAGVQLAVQLDGRRTRAGGVVDRLLASQSSMVGEAGAPACRVQAVICRSFSFSSVWSARVTLVTSRTPAFPFTQPSSSFLHAWHASGKGRDTTPEHPTNKADVCLRLSPPRRHARGGVSWLSRAVRCDGWSRAAPASTADDLADHQHAEYRASVPLMLRHRHRHRHLSRIHLPLEPRVGFFARTSLRRGG